MKACWPLMGVRCISDRWTWKEGLAAFIFALLVVLLIALAQQHGFLDALNLRGMAWAGAARTSDAGLVATPVMIAASVAGDSAARMVLAALAAFALWWRGRAAAALWLLLVVLGGMLLNSALKQAFAAPRPDLLPHLDNVHSYSFPSGHAAGAMVLAGAQAMLTRWRPAVGVAAVIVALVGVSRLWLGVHWPSDLLAGWVTGLGWLALCAAWLPAWRGQQ